MIAKMECVSHLELSKFLNISQNKWLPSGESSEKRRQIDDIEIERGCRIQGIGS
jgi:hypothetical protein